MTRQPDLFPRFVRDLAVTRQERDPDTTGDPKKLANIGAAGYRENGLASTLVGLQLMGSVPGAMSIEQYVGAMRGVAREMVREQRRNGEDKT